MSRIIRLFELCFIESFFFLYSYEFIILVNFYKWEIYLNFFTSVTFICIKHIVENFKILLLFYAEISS